MGSGSSIRRGASASHEENQAVDELYEQIGQPSAELTVLFVSPSYDLQRVQQRIGERFGRERVIGCTTAGEFGALGYRSHSMSGFSLGSDEFVVETAAIDDLGSVDFPKVHQVISSMKTKLEQRGVFCTQQDTFSYLLIDGMSAKEEIVVSALYAATGGLPLFGGSAGDALQFRQTKLLYDGAFRSDRAVFSIVNTDRVFEVFKTQHFVLSPIKLVVTEADPDRRIVKELNGEPAAEAYAQALGLSPDQLTPTVFAQHPVVLRLGQTNYVRSIQKVNEDQSLSFYCAIDEGIVLTIAEGRDLLENISGALERASRHVGGVEMVIGCDCVLRNIEVDERHIKSQVGEVFDRYNVVGFSTYGEQFNAMHVNQTFCGVALGRRRAK